MRDNLIFEGIPERLRENTEEVIKNFIQTELDISDEIDFHRVHRMGKQKAKNTDLSLRNSSYTNRGSKYAEQLRKC
jgi:hypothetical protein